MLLLINNLTKQAYRIETENPDNVALNSDVYELLTFDTEAEMQTYITEHDLTKEGID